MKRPLAGTREINIYTSAIVSSIFFIATQLVSNPACDDSSVPEEDIIRGHIGNQAHDFLQEMTEEGFSGAALLSYRGEVLLKSGYGYANRDKLQPNNSETLFNIASVSKIFTASAILSLEEERKISVDDPLSLSLGSFPAAKSSATVHHLLTHTAGLAIRGTQLDYDSRQSFVESMKAAPIESPPGQEFRYTNAGYTVLAAIVEEIAELPFERFVRQRVFAPACMMRTAFAWDEIPQIHTVAVGYAGNSRDQLVATPPEADVWGNRGPGGIVTNVGDLYRWVLAMKDARVISRASMEKMFTAHVGDEGYGWHVVHTENGLLVRRGGGLPDFESSLRWYMDDDLVIIVLINTHLGFRVPVVRGLESIVFGSTETSG